MKEADKMGDDLRTRWAAAVLNCCMPSTQEMADSIMALGIEDLSEAEAPELAYGVRGEVLERVATGALEDDEGDRG